MRQRIWQRLRRTSLGQMRSTSLKLPRYSHPVSDLQSLCTRSHHQGHLWLGTSWLSLCTVSDELVRVPTRLNGTPSRS